MINILTAFALTHPPCVCVRLLGLAPKDQIAMEPILCEAPSLFAVVDETEKKKEIHTETNRKTETERGGRRDHRLQAMVYAEEVKETQPNT